MQTNNSTIFNPLSPRQMLSICLSQRASGVLKSTSTEQNTVWFLELFAPLCCVSLRTKLPCKQCFQKLRSLWISTGAQFLPTRGRARTWTPARILGNFFFFFFEQLHRKDAYKKVAPRPDRRSADLDTPLLSMNSLLLLALLGCLGKCKCPLILNWPIYLVHSCGFALVGDACQSESAGTVFAAPLDNVRWCLKSFAEYQKCQSIAGLGHNIACVPKDNTLDCIIAIRVRRIND